MKKENLIQPVSSGVALLILLSIILTGLHGLISLIFLMIISRMEIGRDPEDKHGVSSGASRLGGVALIFSLMSGVLLNIYISDASFYEGLTNQFTYIFLFSILVGFVGLIEDLKQSLSSLFRLFVITTIILISFLVMSYILPNELGIFLSLDQSFREILIYFFTVIMVVGFINAGNIADGANGLLSLSYLAFFYCLYTLSPSIFHLSMIVSLLIFVIYNIGTGRVFLGDFGAYFLSALVAYSSLEAYQNHEVSVFFFATILVYPCFEISRSLLLRFINKVSLMSPDNNHLHNKLNNYFLNNGLNSHQSNSMTGVFLAFISSALPTYLFVNDVDLPDGLWFELFVFQFMILSSIYLLLGKINLKKT
jgi:UDP-GlcNAc:undecaprenyl-phosphate/decaprenyl-phosphate GlcNAc-1-phosphate transferase